MSDCVDADGVGNEEAQPSDGTPAGHQAPQQTESAPPSVEQKIDDSNSLTRRVNDKSLISIDFSLAKIFTDSGIVIGASWYGNSVSEHHQFKDGKLHTIHIFGDNSGDTSAGVYIPKEFNDVSITSKDTVVAKNPTTGEVILIAHVKIGEGKKGVKKIKENMKRM